MDENYPTCTSKQRRIIDRFAPCDTPQKRYEKIIEMGHSLPPILVEHKVEENLIAGCQSIVYLHANLREGKLFFTAYADALISAGLAALLIETYEGEAPETVLKCKPLFLTELDIPASLSLGRSNGLASMYTRMQQDALKFLVHL